MAQSGSGKVKIVSLEIVEFKNLQKGKVVWELDKDHFGIITVQNFCDRSTIFEAFEFGFGQDTDAATAGIIIVLESEEFGTIKIKHSKNISRRKVMQEFGIQRVDIEMDYQTMNQEQYFDQLAELKLFASNQAFFFQERLNDIFASDKVDLRPFLEMYLLNKPYQGNDYEQKEIEKEVFAQNKQFANWADVTLARMKTGYQKGREEKSQMLTGERDLYFLQMFYHLKYKEVLKEALNDDNEVVLPPRTMDNLIAWINEWVTKLNKYGVKGPVRLETDATVAFIASRKKDAETQITSIEQEIQILDAIKTANGTENEKLQRFRDAYDEFESIDVDLQIEVGDARYSLSAKQDDQNLAKNDSGWSSQIKQSLKTGYDFIWPTSNTRTLCTNKLKRLVRDTHANLQRAEKFKTISYEFDLTNYHKEVFRSFKARLTTSVDHFVFNTKDLQMRKTVRFELKKNSEWLRRRACDVVQKYSQSKNCLIESTNFDTVHSALPLRKVLNEIEMSHESDLSEIMDRIRDQKFRVYDQMDNETTVMDASDATHTLDLLEKALENAEKNMAQEYNKYFGEILQEMGLNLGEGETDIAKTIAVVNCLKRYEYVSNNDEIIESLEQNRENIHRQIQNHVTSMQTEMVFFDCERLSDLQAEWKSIMEKFVEIYKGLVDRINKVFLDEKTFAIQYAINDILKKEWVLPFDPAENNSAQAYLDLVSQQNRQTFDPNRQSIVKIHEMVVTQMLEVEHAINAMAAYKDSLIIYDEAPVNVLLRKIRSIKKKMSLEFVTEKRKFDKRADDFEAPYGELFEKFNELAKFCSQKWDLQLNLDNCTSLYMSAIRMYVKDGPLDEAFATMATLSHHVAGLILKLAINLTIGSPILIFDSFDYILERALINLLKMMVEKYGIQVFFIVLKPLKDLTGGSVHQTWNDKMEVDQIADISRLVFSRQPSLRGAVGNSSAPPSSDDHSDA